MLVERIRAAYAEAAAKDKWSGNPTGSRLGDCAAKLQQVLYPALSKPEPTQPRGRRRMDQGKVLEAWLAKDIHAVYPGLWGLRNVPFYFPVPVPDTATVNLIASRLRSGREDRDRAMFWGWPVDNFAAPRVEHVGEKNGKPQLRVRGSMASRPDYSDENTERDPSVVLDRENGLVYVVVYIDGMILHPDAGLTVVEQKTMSTPAFRRTILGDMDYRYRCQLLGEVVATGSKSALWIVDRHETCHLLEMGWRKDADRVQLRFIDPSGRESAYVVADTKQRGHLIDEHGEVSEFLDDSEWDTAVAWSPYSDSLLPKIHERVLRVLTVQEGQWYREAGPNFTCPKCGGAGKRLCKPCGGTGAVMSKTKVPAPRACGYCGLGAARSSGVLGYQRCLLCEGRGTMLETALPWVCSYCPVTMTCWQAAGVTLHLAKGRKPSYRITLEDFTKSGLTFTPPEAADPLLPEESNEDESVEEEA